MNTEHNELATHCSGRNCGARARDSAEHPVPDDWILTYNGAVDDGPDGLLCPDCQDDESIIEHMTRNAEADAIIAQATRDQALDDEHGPLPGGRRSDAILAVGRFDPAYVLRCWEAKHADAIAHALQLTELPDDHDGLDELWAVAKVRLAHTHREVVAARRRLAAHREHNTGD